MVYYKYQKKKYHFLVLGNYLRIFTHSITRRPVDNGSVCSISSVSNDLVEINAVGLREAKRLRGKNQKKKKSTKLLFECHCKPIIKSSKPKDSSVLMPPAVSCAVLISLWNSRHCYCSFWVLWVCKYVTKSCIIDMGWLLLTIPVKCAYTETRGRILWKT